MSRILKWDPKRTDREEVGVQVVLGSRISSLLRNYYANDPKYPWRPFLYSEVALLLMLGEIQATTITSEIVRHLTHLLTLHTSSIRIWKKVNSGYLVNWVFFRRFCCSSLWFEKPSYNKMRAGNQVEVIEVIIQSYWNWISPCACKKSSWWVHLSICTKDSPLTRTYTRPTAAHVSYDATDSLQGLYNG